MALSHCSDWSRENLYGWEWEFLSTKHICYYSDIICIWNGWRESLKGLHIWFDYKYFSGNYWKSCIIWNFENRGVGAPHCDRVGALKML